MQIKRLPYLIALGMEGAGRSGVAGSASERRTMAENVLAGTEMYPDNHIINAIVPKGIEKDQRYIAAYEQHDEVLNCLEDINVRDYKELRNHISKVITNVLKGLTAQETQESVEDYKKWLLIIALEVARAGKEGDFLGIGGIRFSPEEKEFYSELSEVLQ